jgi:lipopolysaccharide biosynthesis protein
LFDLGLRWEDYPEEPISQDATILHAIERLFGIIPEQIGYRTLLTHVSGLIR